MYRPFDATQGQLLPTSSQIFQTLVPEMCFCAEITFLAQSRISVTKKKGTGKDFKQFSFNYKTTLAKSEESRCLSFAFVAVAL